MVPPCVAGKEPVFLTQKQFQVAEKNVILKSIILKRKQFQQANLMQRYCPTTLSSTTLPTEFSRRTSGSRPDGSPRREHHGRLRKAALPQFCLRRTRTHARTGNRHHALLPYGKIRSAGSIRKQLRNANSRKTPQAKMPVSQEVPLRGKMPEARRKRYLTVSPEAGFRGRTHRNRPEASDPGFRDTGCRFQGLSAPPSGESPDSCVYRN